MEQSVEQPCSLAESGCVEKKNVLCKYCQGTYIPKSKVIRSCSYGLIPLTTSNDFLSNISNEM